MRCVSERDYTSSGRRTAKGWNFERGAAGVSLRHLGRPAREKEVLVARGLEIGLVVVRVEAISQVLPLLLGGRGDGRQRLGGDGAVADGIHAAARVRHAQIVVDLPEITRDDTR